MLEANIIEQNSGWRVALQKGTWRCWLTEAQCESAVCALLVQRETLCALSVLECQSIKHSITSHAKEVIIPLYSDLVWPHLGYCVLIWGPHFKKNVGRMPPEEGKKCW